MPNFAPFTDRIFVDFSGDDGSKPGSTRTICMAWVLSAEENLAHNRSVVDQIKTAIGCRLTDELKYKTLRRHRKKQQALGLLVQLSVHVILVPVLKDRIEEEHYRDPKTKKLVSLIHFFPISNFMRYFDRLERSVYFQLVFDDIGWDSCRADIVDSYRHKSGLDWANARPDWLMFGNSAANPMLQLADIFAGIGREYMEGLDRQKMPDCRPCWVRKTTLRCRHQRKGLTVGNDGLLRLIYPLLLKGPDGSAYEEGLIARPPKVAPEFMFADCLIGKKRK